MWDWSQSIPNGGSVSLALYHFIDRAAAASLEILWALLALYRTCFWTVSSLTGMKLLSSVLPYSRLWRMWAAFVISFFFYESAAVFALYIVLSHVWAQKERFLLRNREIREQVSEIPSACESALSAATRHCVSRLSMACSGGNGGLGVRRRELSLGAKLWRHSLSPVIMWMSGLFAGHEPCACPHPMPWQCLGVAVFQEGYSSALCA